MAGDVAETTTDILWAMELLSERFTTVVRVPGNHGLWTVSDDPVQLRGRERYLHLVDSLRALGVHTPEDTRTKDEALDVAYEAGVVCTDEYLLHPDPYPGRDAWCRARLEYTRRRLDSLDPELPTVLVNHYPLVREPTRVLHYPEFAQWCGTEATADWHVRYRARAVVYGHLHIPRTITVEGVPHIEVSLGYPREWAPRPRPPEGPRHILP